MVTMDVTGTEYREVKALFEVSRSVNKTSSSQKQNHRIVRIQRVQNPQLYKEYVTRKKGMDRRNPSGFQNERRLFHGCPKDVTELISHQGFNRSFAGKNGNVCACIRVYYNQSKVLFFLSENKAGLCFELQS